MQNVRLASRRLVPPLSALIAFEAAARHGSFTRAADELSLTQSAISRRVNMLEEMIGVQLFRRIRNSVVLTEAGIFYVGRVQDTLRDLGLATHEASLFLGRGRVLRLGALPTFTARWLMPRIGVFLQKNRNIEMSFSNCLPGEIDGMPDEFDAFICCREPAQRELQFDKLLDERIVVVAHPACAKAFNEPAALLSTTLLAHKFRPDAWPQWFCAQGLEQTQPSIVHSFGDFSLVVEAAISKIGVALVPEKIVERELMEHRLVTLFEDLAPASRAIYLACPIEKSSYPPVQTFRKWLIENCCEERMRPQVA